MSTAVILSQLSGKLFVRRRRHWPRGIVPLPDGEQLKDGQSDLRSLAGRPVRLRIVMKDADRIRAVHGQLCVNLQRSKPSPIYETPRTPAVNF